MSRYHAAHTQPLGISIDSVYCHANWAQSLGGISFPLLSDFNPKGAVAESYGLYLEKAGITDRATVIIDADGMVQHISSVTPSGERNIAELADLCEEVDRKYEGSLPEIERPPGLSGRLELLVKSGCGFSRAVLLARDNLHLEDRIATHNVTEDEGAMARLRELTGKEQAPCLVVDGEPMLESQDIIRYLVTRTTGWWSPEK